jgi:hypothetical protein
LEGSTKSWKEKELELTKKGKIRPLLTNLILPHLLLQITYDLLLFCLLDSPWCHKFSHIVNDP